MPEEVEKLCNVVHSIMQDATNDLPIPKPENTRLVRKKISVFTYGIIRKLVDATDIHEDIVYENYLIMGGLSKQQASTIVKRTRDEFLSSKYGFECLKAGEDAMNKWQSGDKNISPIIKNLM